MLIGVRSSCWLLAAASFLLAPAASAVVTIDWLTVSDAENACDPQPQGCFGGVSRPYQISKFEVTNAQYAEFLNAVAATDTNALYNASMATPASPDFGGITQSGSSGSFTYSAIGGREDLPVNWVSFFDALRFANWLHNGQPTGAQGSTTTENGAYDMSLGDNVVRKGGAQVFLPDEDQWYKAAYYDPGSMIYFDYPTGTDTLTVCAAPGATPNTAKCDDLVSGAVDVGGYTASASPVGTFDQGGNVWEWNETEFFDSSRGNRGGSYLLPGGLEGQTQFLAPPSDEGPGLGFRVANRILTVVPSLSSLSLVLLSGLLGVASWWKLRD